MNNLCSFFVFPSETLSGTSLANRFDQICIKTTDSGIEIFQGTSGYPVTSDIKVTLSTVYIPCCRRFGSDCTLETEFCQLVVSCLYATCCLEFSISKIAHLEGERFAFIVPYAVYFFKTGFFQQFCQQLLRRVSTSLHQTC